MQRLKEYGIAGAPLLLLGLGCLGIAGAYAGKVLETTRAFAMQSLQLGLFLYGYRIVEVLASILYEKSKVLSMTPGLAVMVAINTGFPMFSYVADYTLRCIAMSEDLGYIPFGQIMFGSWLGTAGLRLVIALVINKATVKSISEVLR